MTLRVGSTVGPYEIAAPLGAGGMGEVYRARDPRLHRDVALKILLPELASSSFHLRRFEQEARAASALNHPGIVAIYDVGRQDSLAYIAMELVEGQTLRVRMQDHILTLRETLRIIAEVAEALAAAHEHGIVHRDLKPENLIVATSGYVKVLDFGLAKLARPFAAADEETTPQTQPGSVLGTIAYMSPEQASGSELDFRSDQFSMGVILYELVTGNRPFGERTAAETLVSIMRKDPEPLSETVPAVPPELERIVTRLLAKEPRDRYASTLDFARDLREVLDLLSHPSSSGRRSGTRNTKRYLRARELMATGVLALVVAGGGSWAYFRHQKSTSARVTPERNVESASLAGGTPRPSAVSAANQQLYLEVLGSLQSPENEAAIDQALERLRRLLENERDSAAVNTLQARALVSKYGITRRSIFAEQAAIFADRAVQLDPGSTDAHAASGDVKLVTGKFAEAAAAYERVLTAEPGRIDTVLALARSYNGLGRAAEAEKRFQEAIALRPDLARAFNLYGAFCFNRGRYDRAVELYQRVVALTPQSARGFTNLGAAYQALGRYDAALAAHRQAMTLSPSAIGYSNLGTCEFSLGRFADSVVSFEKAIELTPDNYVFWWNLGDACRWAPGMRNRSMKAYAEAIRLARESQAVNPRDAMAPALVASALAKSGRVSAAGAEIDKALRIDPTNAVVLYQAGVVAILGGSPRRGAEWIAQSLDSGYSAASAAHDPELNPIRETAEFRVRIEKARKSS